MAAITLLLGALAATAQDDIKRVLAWSTVSQIGYMTGALAVGCARRRAVPPAHPRRVQGAAVPRRRRGDPRGRHQPACPGWAACARTMPVTFWSFVIGLGALAGVPPLAGFWTKENVLAAAAHATEGGEAGAGLGGLAGLARRAGRRGDHRLVRDPPAAARLLRPVPGAARTARTGRSASTTRVRRASPRTTRRG